MGRGRDAETELMPRLVVGYTELVCGKLKSGKGFLKPNFELGPKPSLELVLRGKCSSRSVSVISVSLTSGDLFVAFTDQSPV